MEEMLQPFGGGLLSYFGQKAKLIPRSINPRKFIV